MTLGCGASIPTTDPFGSLSEPVPCAASQSGSLDTGAAQATCCALSEAIRGHNAVTALFRAAAQSCDHTAETEVPGVIPGTDVLTTVLATGHLLSARPAGRSRLHPNQACCQARLL